MPRWQAKGWKTSAGAEVKNKEMFMILNKRIQSMDSVSWVKQIQFSLNVFSLMKIFFLDICSWS